MSNTVFALTTVTPLKTFSRFTAVTQGLDCDTFFLPKDEYSFFIRHIRANHSTLRCIHFIVYDKLPKTVISQLLRATKGHPQPEVESSRPDWTGKERSFDPYEEKLFAQEHTAESFILLCRQRLCRKTELLTRQAVQNWVNVLRESEEPFFRALASLCVPSCEYTNRCDELSSCGHIEALLLDRLAGEEKR